MPIRPLRWPDDREALLTLDTGFSTLTILEVIQTPDSFALAPQARKPALSKTYDLAGEVDDLPDYTCALVAELDGVVLGLSAFRYEAWNRRANLVHFYLDCACRGRGLGREMMLATLHKARQTEARCLWLETQSVNYGAIKFYERMGFQFCGLDTTLYEPSQFSGEVALFYAHPLI